MLEARKREPALKNRLVGDAETHKGQQKSSECVLLEILSVQSSEKSKRRDGQVHRQVYTASDTSERRLAGHAACFRHERTSDHPRYVISIQ